MEKVFNADKSPLFNESEATETITSLDISDLSDGSWAIKLVYLVTYKSPCETSVRTPDNSSSVKLDVLSQGRIETRDFTVSGGSSNFTAGTDIREYNMDDANKEKLSTFAAEQGLSLSWSGNTADIAFDSTSGVIFASMCQTAKKSGYIAKKNAEGTRYLVKHHNDSDTNREAYYLMKK